MSHHDSSYIRLVHLILRKKALVTFIGLTVAFAAICVSYALPKVYEAKSTVFIEKNVISDLVKGIAVAPSRETSVKVLTYALSGRSLTTKVLNDLDYGMKQMNDARIDRLITDIQKNTTIKVSADDFFIVSFRHENPRFARDYVNSLVRRYIEESTASKREESYEASRFLADQIKSFGDRKDKSENVMLEYKQEKGGVINLDEGRILAEINVSQQKIYDLQLKRRILEGQLALMKNFSDPARSKLVTLKKQLEEMRTQYTDKFPDVVNLKLQIETMEKELTARKETSSSLVDPQEAMKIDLELKAIAENETTLKAHIEKNQKLLGTIPAYKSDLRKLENNMANEKNIHDLLLLRHDQSEVAKQMELQNKNTSFRVVDPAVTPTHPVAPNRLRIMLLGIAGGLALGIGLVLGLDMLDGSIKTVDDMRKLGPPVLAIVPHMKDEEQKGREESHDKMVALCAGIGYSLIGVVMLAEFLGINLLRKVLG